MPTEVRFKTKSEELFADYLDWAKYRWEYEPQIPGHTKRPDFLVTHTPDDLLYDVKERSPTEMPSGLHCIDPIDKIRKLIEKGRETFRDFDDRPCALVVYNNGDFETSLHPSYIYGAMLGQPGIQFPIDPETGTMDGDAAESVFLPSGGKMIRHYDPLEPHESTRNMSAIIALAEYRIRNPAYDPAHAEAEARQVARLDRPLTDREQFSINYDLITGGTPLTLGEALGVTVCVNPFARYPFPETIFKGAYDERWAITDGAMTRVFGGKNRQSSEDD